MSLLFFFHIQFVFAQDAATVDFSDAYDRIYQIRVVSQDAGGKSAIGSGFQVTVDGLIVTNYHVVSDFVTSPEQYKIEYVSVNGDTGHLELLDFDIINDLAVLQHPEPTSDHFPLAGQTLDRGQVAYALGNPGDWGIVLVSGPTNGLVEHRYDDRVLFSGSLNSGMSGGPSLNSNGEIIGVNVATAGSQLSFLVPVGKVKNLLSRQRKVSSETFEAEITKQVVAWQQPRIQELLDADWKSEQFLGRKLFGEIRKDFQCWGDTNEENQERTTEVVRKSCRTGDEIYIGSDINAGQIRFSFSSSKPVKLNDMQFSRGQSLYMGADNRSNYEHSTNYVCETDFIDVQNDAISYHRVVTCIRAYKKMGGLYDSLLMSMRNTGKEVFKAHLSLSALKKDQIQEMNERFLEKSL